MTSETALLRCLERRFPPAVEMRRESFGGLTSFRLELLTLRFEAGGEAQVLLKDFGSSRLPKEDLPARRIRERRVYRDLLGGAGLQTAEYYGDVWEEPAGPYWLLLEFVDSVELRSLSFPDWVKAAGWLGRLHGRFARSGADLAACDYLVRHDSAFFRAQAELARRAAADYPADLRERVAGVLERYQSAIGTMTAQPRTLVHGSYRPQNILVERAAANGRVFAVDWELAAFGAPLYDFAFLADGFRGEKFDALWEAYHREAARGGIALPRREDLTRVVDCFRLHKTLKSIGDSVPLKFGENVIKKLVGMAAEIGSRLFELPAVRQPPAASRQPSEGTTPMAKGSIPEPDWKAWREILPGRIEPERMERLTGNRSKTAVFRLPGAGPGGLPAIVKFCTPEVAVLERTIYERVLPCLPLTAPHYYGALEAGGGCSWIFLEDIEGEKFSFLCEEHRILAARWLGVLHSRAVGIQPAPVLPDRGPGHYLGCLRSARETILRSLGNPALAVGDAPFLEEVVLLCDSVERQWAEIEGFCRTLPVTLVHGDFRPKNARVRAVDGGSALFPIDWEMAGWGIPAVDLAPARRSAMAPLVDPATYEEIVRESWPEISVSGVARVARLGAVFRRLAAIRWASQSLGSLFPEKQMASIKIYRSELEEALVSPPWAQ